MFADCTEAGRQSAQAVGTARTMLLPSFPGSFLGIAPTADTSVCWLHTHNASRLAGSSQVTRSTLPCQRPGGAAVWHLSTGSSMMHTHQWMHFREVRSAGAPIRPSPCPWGELHLQARVSSPTPASCFGTPSLPGTAPSGGCMPVTPSVPAAAGSAWSAAPSEAGALPTAA